MKKNSAINLCSLLLTICALVVLASCADICEDKNGEGCSGGMSNISYTSSAPPEKLCTLNILGTLTVKKFDGEDVNWSKNVGDSWMSVQIPAGSHTFVLNYKKAPMFGNYHIIKNGMIFSYDGFVAGHTYKMMIKSDTWSQSLKISLLDVTQGHK